jgi:hypothetical protein
MKTQMRRLTVYLFILLCAVAHVEAADLFEKAYVPGTVSSVKRGTVIKTSSGSIYEVTSYTYEYPHETNPEIVVLKDWNTYKIIMNGVDEPIECKLLVAPRDGRVPTAQPASTGRVPSRPEPPLPPDLFKKVQPSLAILTTKNGVGSAFVLDMDGKKYLITNDHVLRGGDPVKAALLDGRVLQLGSVEVANTRDLVRVHVKSTDAQALSLASIGATVGQTVGVFGNSEGSGVATSIGGRLLGVGPETIETDAPFVRGNSGSPIVTTDGHVLAVASFVTRSSDPDDWVKQGTRFTNVRRFGTTLSGIKWVPMEWDQYMIRASALADIETFCIDLYHLRYTDAFVDAGTKLFDYEYAEQRERYQRFFGLCKLLADAVETFNPAIQRERSARYYAKESTRGGVQRRIDAERYAKMDAMVANSRFKEHAAAYRKVYTEAHRFITRNDWITDGLKSEAVFWLKVLRIVTEKTDE